MRILNPNCRVSIAIPTFNRGEILLKSLALLENLDSKPREILVIDQTPEYSEEVGAALAALAESGKIHHIRLAQPSIPHAMNVALTQATGSLVLYLDDDIIPMAGLVEQHERAHTMNSQLWATVGQVVQPWQKPESLEAPKKLKGLATDYDFPFHSNIDSDVENVMAGNLCINRERILSIGGFDEQFVGAAYRFETEFARRVSLSGGKIRFIGSAGIYHLRAATGGTRETGSHMTSSSPKYGFGDYYYAFKHGRPVEAWVYSIKRIFREVRTRFHLTHPWWIPVKLLGEIRALILAQRKIKEGQRLLLLELSD